MQAHGAEMLRIACCLATERGVRVCAPVHDALLIEAPISLIDDAVSTTRGAMAEAAAKALGSAVWIDTDVEIVRYPGPVLRTARSSHVGSGDVPAQQHTSSNSSTFSTSSTSSA